MPREDGAINTIRTARRPQPCDGYRCSPTGHRRPGKIQPGQRYTRSALPPHGELGNETWWTANLCTDCRPIPEAAR